ncbi:MAG: 16S rRNA processing protein RimM [Myxococcales bacterium]|nr:16S rRNA processing protein RimM [Myxococcales bacterium]
MAEPRRIEVGRIGRPHGVHGELRVHLHDPGSTVLDAVEAIDVHVPGQPARTFAIHSVRGATGGPILALRGIDDREAAARLTHGTLQVDADQLPPPGADEIWLADLVGAAVLDADTRARVGVVRGIVVAGGHDMLHLTLDAGGSVLLPPGSPAIEELGRVAGEIVVRDIHDWRSE